MIFGTPVGFLLDPTGDDDAAVYPPASPPAPPSVPPPPCSPVPAPALHYCPAIRSKVHPSQRKFFDNTGRSFAELPDDKRVVAQWTIADVVSSTTDTKSLYYKYHGGFSPPPVDVGEFEYS